MKIINIKTGKPYQLSPDTVIEIERPNPFFNTYGEQSMPLSLPASEYNRALLSYQEDIAASLKQQADIDAAIIDKDFYMTCRQAILSSKKKDKISTSFYLNEGAFYTKLSDIALKDIFGTESISGVTTVEEGIEFCRSLITGSNSRYAIFPVLIDLSEVDGTIFSRRYNYFESKGYKFLNRYGYMSSDNIFIDAIGTGCDFYNAVARTEKSGDDTVSLSPGYYITPFMRCIYLLQRIFTYLGYTLKDNFFSKTVPFTDMVIVNNTMDSLVNSDIRIADLVPNCKLSTILEMFRKKFCCEFIPDEIHKTMDIVLFSDIINSDSGIDITGYATSEAEITYPEKYQSVKIGSEDKVSDNDSASEVSSLSVLVSKYPHSEIDNNDGSWYRYGADSSYGVRSKTMECNEGYLQDSLMKEFEIAVPDKSPIQKVSPSEYPKFSAIYIGESQALNSVLSNATTSSSSSSAKTTDQKPILCFFHKMTDGYPLGSCTNYYFGSKIFDYTLYYNGPDGIFEKFYRVFDSFIRNSKHTVKVDLLLPQELKMNIKAHEILIFKGQKLFINTLKFNIGGKEAPVESQLYTTKNHTPTVTAKTYDEIIKVDMDGLHWEFNSSETSCTEDEYKNNTASKMSVVYPPPASSRYIIGTHYFSQYNYIANVREVDDRAGTAGTVTYDYYKYEFWWEVVKDS